ncbi:DNA polymerase/3'-5' exonuclease PolX [Halobacterium sp. CBA1126]|uniref:DNA polymerase/3'-5' exonuclease PolX n=1 Tax=Halobacterium sp. CBA1126 TaxID=2668074 RepID=UPI0012F8001D|nr:DNA polymerase/3'-5' exonuclease PolX [Halobacterium sp. CBA1126]MUV60457.1 DNA polymerase/3'-5' exonuclease PolX [Halobacterium sp. CBA1126]
MSRNNEVAGVLEEYADLLEAQGVDYKPNTYRRAASNVRDYPEAVEDLAAEGADAVQRIDGVGEAIASKVVEYVETGEIEELEAEREKLPVDIEELTAVEGVGPKTVRKLYDALGVQTLDDLEAAAEGGEIQDVEGFGPKTEQNILDHVGFARQAQERELLGDGRPIAEDVRAFLADLDEVDRVEVAGSTRRWRETIGDVDVLVASDAGEAVGEALTAWDRADETLDLGPTKTSVRANRLRVDIRVVVDEEFGAALQYFTGSKDHNVTVRNHAIDQAKKVNEYGVFDVSEVDDPDAGQRVGERLASETEEDVYDALGLPWIPPELREDRGEVEAAAAGDLPDLLADDDVRGDLHAHTEWSDGDLAVEEMVAGAAEFGHDYVAVTDHAEGPGVFGDSGLSDDDLREQAEEVAAVREDAAIDVFHGVEANVDADGNVGDVSDDVLADLDVVVASPHSGLGDDGGDQTERLIAAVEHPHVDVLGHPSGRLINDRPAMEFDPGALAEAAADAGTALEVNSNPHRLDLWGSVVQTAVEAGATVAVNTDAHSTSEYANVEYGVHTARRGWAEAGDVLNARDADGVREFLD